MSGQEQPEQPEGKESKILAVSIGDIFIRNKASHDRLDSCDFLKRYSEGSLILLDHLFHLIQLKEIYQAIESQFDELFLKTPGSYFLAYFFDDWRRSLKIQADIEFLRFSLEGVSSEKIERAQVLLFSTKELIRTIKIADEGQLVGHFLVRILGDLFGGQVIKKQLQKLYQSKSIEIAFGVVDSLEPSGLSFYGFSPELNTRSMGSKLREIQVSQSTKDKILEATALSFASHEKIFLEAEGHRVNYAGNLRKVLAPAAFSTPWLLAFGSISLGLGTAWSVYSASIY